MAATDHTSECSLGCSSPRCKNQTPGGHITSPLDQTMSSTPTHDAIIIGGGHNGPVCAAYLGMAGLKVKVLERRAGVGGAGVTEEFYPGLRNSVAAYTGSLLNPQVIRDLRLHDHVL